MKNKIFKIICIIPIILISTLIGGLILSGIFRIFIGKDNIKEYMNIIMLLSYIFVFFGLLFYNKYILKERLSYIWLRLSTSRFIVGYVHGIALASVMFIIAHIMGLVSFNGINKSFIPMAILFFIGFIFQSTCEELIMRGFITRWVYNRFGKAVGIMAPSVLFAAMHLGNPSMKLFGFLNTILIGILFAIYMFNTNTIDFPSGMYSAWNFFISIIFGFKVSGIETGSLFNFVYKNSEIIGGGYGPEASYVLSIIILILIGANLLKTNLIKRYEE